MLNPGTVQLDDLARRSQVTQTHLLLQTIDPFLKIKILLYDEVVLRFQLLLPPNSLRYPFELLTTLHLDLLPTHEHLIQTHPLAIILFSVIPVLYCVLQFSSDFLFPLCKFIFLVFNTDSLGVVLFLLILKSGFVHVCDFD